MCVPSHAGIIENEKSGLVTNGVTSTIFHNNKANLLLHRHLLLSIIIKQLNHDRNTGIKYHLQKN